MKNWQGLFGFAILLSMNILCADNSREELADFPDQTTFDEKPSPDAPHEGPFNFKLEANYAGRAKFDKCWVDGDLKFGEIDFDSSYTFLYNPCNKEGFSFILGASHVKLDWAENPYFNTTDFNMVTVGLGAFSQRNCDWSWKAYIKMNFNPNHLNFNQYVNFDFLVWGRYDLGRNWGFNAGLVGITGMKIDRVYPIVGIDWTPNDRWKLNLIFPLDASLSYIVNDSLAVYLGSRVWELRNRVGKSQNLKRALWEYRAAGGEIGVNFKWLRLLANVHVGYNFGGRLKITNENHRRPKKFNFNGSIYAGGELSVNF